MSIVSILDNSPKGEDFFYVSKKGLGFVHVDAAGASFCYSLEAAQRGQKELAYRPSGLEDFARPERTLGAKVGQLFAKGVVDLLDQNPSLPLNKAYQFVANSLTTQLDKRFGYLGIPVWQREAWSFSHIFIMDDMVSITRVGDVSTFLIDKTGRHELLPVDEYHSIESSIQKERIRIITQELGFDHGTNDFFCLDYAGFTYNEKTYEGLVQNRIDMIQKRGLWSKASGVFQAILGEENTWTRNAEIITIPAKSLSAVLTCSDGLFEKGRSYKLLSEDGFVEAAQNPQTLAVCASSVRAYEATHKGKAFSDDLSAVYFPIAQSLSKLDCM